MRWCTAPLAAQALGRRSNSVGRVKRQQQQRHVAVDLRQVVEEVERAVVGPVQVVELQHERRARRARDAAQRLRGGMEAAVADLPGVVADAADVAAAAVVQADQVAEQVGVGLGLARRLVVGEQRHRCPARACRLATSMLSLSRMCRRQREQVAQQAVGLALRLRRRARLKEVGALGRAPRPSCSNSYSSRLLPTPASPTTTTRSQPAPGCVKARRTLLQSTQLGVAADHARLDAFDAAARIGRRAAVARSTR